MVFHNLVRIFYYIPIIYGAFAYKLKGGLVVSSIVVVLYAPHLLIYFGEVNFEIIYQLLELLMFIATGLGAGYLVQRDHVKRNAIDEQIIKITDLENYNHNILDSIESGVVAFDGDGKIKFANQLAKEEFNGIDKLESILIDYSINAAIIDILKGNKKSIEREIIYEQDSYEINCLPLKTINNVIEGVIVIIKKITLLKSLEEQVRRGERLAAVGNLAAGIAHEIRNPLGIIKTISQTLQHEQNYDKALIENLKEGLEIIDHEIDRANEVVKWLLDFAKPEQYNLEPINLTEVATQLATIFNKYSEEKLVHIKVDVTENVWTYGDMEKLKQAFVNIMLNGIQSIKGSGSIELTLNSLENYSVLIFKDTGTGIKKEILHKIFNPFFTTKEEGTGLGLAITHKIIENHRGNLKIESEEGKGTKIMVYLPKFLGVTNEK